MSRFKLLKDKEGLFLEDRFSKQNPLRIDFQSQEFRHRLTHAGKKSELVARAVKARAGLRVLDCTGGLGREGFLLAYLGCEVTMVERSKTLGAMLKDALTRAQRVTELTATAGRLKIINQDAREFLASAGRYDVVYIDPMFPGREKSALVKGEMQLLQIFLGQDEDATSLVVGAIESGSPRVVVKRPAAGAWDAPGKPDHVFGGKASRFEVFLNF